MTVEVDYNGSKGSKLQANLLNINQVPLSAVNDLIARFGAAGAVALLNSHTNSPQAVAAGIKIPYPNFTNPRCRRREASLRRCGRFRSTARSTRPTAAATRPGKSMYHAGVLKLTQRLSNGFLFQGSYTYSKLMTNADVFSGSTGSMDTAQPDLEYSIGRLDQPHGIKLNTVYELPWGRGGAG